jgi:hydroxyacylglutathione hydrolase
MYASQVPYPLPASEAILDVRRDEEHAAAHIQNSIHLPLHRMPTNLSSLPAQRLWVHCASGYRASIAASLLDRAGLDTVYIDDDFANASATGLPIALPESARDAAAQANLLLRYG